MPKKRKTAQRSHTRHPKRSHSALALLVPYLFERVGVGLTLFDSHGWHAVHVHRILIEFEDEYGVEAERFLYNARCAQEVARTKRPVVGRVGELGDVFVPVITDGRADRLLVAGPFATRPATSAGILDGWRKLTGRSGHLSDPEFARYLAARLATVVFGPTEQRALSKMLTHIAELVAGSGDPETLMRGIVRAQDALDHTTFAVRTWEAAREMVDPMTSRSWASLWKADQRAELGLTAVPDRALVALMSTDGDDSPAVDDVIRRDSFLRACVALARSQKGCIAGRIGEHALVLLTSSERSETRTRAKLSGLADKAVALARRSRIRLHIGVCPKRQSGELPGNYQAALAAAEEAMSRGVVLVEQASTKRRRVQAPRELRRDLATPSLSGALDLVARFEQYLELAATHSGYRLEPMRLHLEAGFERLAEPYVSSGAMDPRSAENLYDALREAGESAQTVNDLFTAYRAAVRHLEEGLQRPTQEHHERSLGRAVALMRQRLGEPLSLNQVARAAGFAPSHFSRLFKAREGVTFRRFLLQLRVERAKQMLGRTTLSIERVGQLCGFTNGPYFHRVFKQVTGETPSAYRRVVRWESPD